MRRSVLRLHQRLTGNTLGLPLAPCRRNALFAAVELRVRPCKLGRAAGRRRATERAPAAVGVGSPYSPHTALLVTDATPPSKYGVARALHRVRHRQPRHVAELAVEQRLSRRRLQSPLYSSHRSCARPRVHRPAWHRVLHRGRPPHEPHHGLDVSVDGGRVRLQVGPLVRW